MSHLQTSDSNMAILFEQCFYKTYRLYAIKAGPKCFSIWRYNQINNFDIFHSISITKILGDNFEIIISCSAHLSNLFKKFFPTIKVLSAYMMQVSSAFTFAAVNFITMRTNKAIAIMTYKHIFISYLLSANTTSRHNTPPKNFSFWFLTKIEIVNYKF